MRNKSRLFLVSALLLLVAGAHSTASQTAGAFKTTAVSKCMVSAFADADYERKVHISIAQNGKTIGHVYTIEATGGSQHVADYVVTNVFEAASKEAARICR
jgi:hypothetical protein